MILKGESFDTFKLVTELIPYISKKYGEKPAVSYYIDKDTVKNKSYNDLYKDVKKFAFYLKEQAFSSQPICLIGEFSYSWLVSFYSIMWIGSYPVLIDNGLSKEETLNLIHISNSKVVIFDNNKKKSDLLASMNDEGLAIIGLNDSIKHLNLDKNVIRIIENEKCEMELPSEKKPDDTALLVYTSGTTGNNKAVLLSHKNLCADLALGYYVAGRSDHKSLVAVLPVHHMLQITAGVQAPLFIGMNICVSKGKKYIVQSITNYKPTTLVLVPSVIEMIRKKIWADVRLKNKEKKLRRAMKMSSFLMKFGIDLRKKFFAPILESLGGNLKIIISGGAPITSETVKEFRTWGIEVYNGYGITECSPIISCNMREYNKDGSVGIVGLEPLCEVKIIDKEICVKGDIVMKGYYNNPKANEEAFKNGYFRTGDIGYIDKEGFLYVTGRKKNLIILSNGENIAPEELELIFSSIEGIKDILVCSKTAGNDMILSAIIVPTNDMKEREDLQEYLNEQFSLISSNLPPQKRIYDVNIRNRDFIMSSSGKVKRIKENYEL